MRKPGLIVILFLLSCVVSAQQKFGHLNQVWYGYFSNIKLNQRWSLNSDVQGRTADWDQQWSQLLARSGIAYKCGAKTTITAGLADFLYFGKSNTANKNECRTWQEYAFSDFYNRWKITHRFRYEQRFFRQIENDEITGEVISSHRLRYKIELQRMIWKSKEAESSLHFQLGNEVMVNAVKPGEGNYFDQNRTAIGLLYALNEKFSFQVQYMNIFQRLSNGTAFNQVNVIRFNIYHTINFAK